MVSGILDNSSQNLWAALYQRLPNLIKLVTHEALKLRYGSYFIYSTIFLLLSKFLWLLHVHSLWERVHVYKNWWDCNKLMKQENDVSVVFNNKWCYMKELQSFEVDFPVARQIDVLFWQICVIYSFSSDIVFQMCYPSLPLCWLKNVNNLQFKSGTDDFYASWTLF